MGEGSIPIACELGAGDLAEQAERWKQLWRAAGVERTETDTGLRLAYRDEPAVERELRALVAVESECCAWVSWNVRRDGGKLVLDAAASGHGITTLHMMFAAG